MFIDAFSIKNPFHQLGPFKCNKTVLKSLYVLLGLSPVWNRYQRFVARKGLPSVQYSRMMNLKIQFAKNFGLLRQTPWLELTQQESII